VDLAVSERDAHPGSSVLVILQNETVPADRRVWNEVCTLRAGGSDVAVICPQGAEEDTQAFETIDGVAIHRYPQQAGSGNLLGHLREYVVAFWRIRRLAKRLAAGRSFDVVLAGNPPDFLLMSVHFLKRDGACLIFDHHDLWPELYLARSQGKKDPLYWLIVATERINFRLADIVLATNETYKRIAVARGGKRPEDVFVVRNGPVLAEFTPVDADPELKRGRPYLLTYIGNMARQDGVDQALYALARLREERQDWHAVIAGDGEAAGDLRQLATGLGLDGHVEFSGWLREDGLKRLLSSSDVCIVPDPKTALSDASTLMKVAEYMAMSKPVVAFDLAESRVTAGEAAVYVAPNDPGAFARAISELLDDPERRERMGAVGRARVVDGLSWEHSEQALLAAHAEALARRRARR
jgi:glycosyltransferase involved in cell wall biosynthesis